MSAAIVLATHVDQDLHGDEVFDIDKERAVVLALFVTLIISSWVIPARRRRRWWMSQGW